MMWYLVVSIKSIGVILVKNDTIAKRFSFSIFFPVFTLQSLLTSKMCKSNVKRKQKGKNKGKRTISKRCGEKNGNPLQYSCLGNPMDRRAWRATAHGVARVRHDWVTFTTTTTTSHWKPWLWYFTFPAWKTRGCSGLIPQISEALIKPQQVKLWLNTFPWGQTSLRRIECSSIFQNSIFSPPLAIRMKGFFSDIYCEKLVELQEVKFTKVVGSPWATGSP